MNRIAYAIEGARKKIDLMKPSKRIGLEIKLKELSFQELFSFQQKKSEAQAMGIINLEEALTIYNALNHWENTDLATKVEVYIGMCEILQKLKRVG